MLDDIIKYRLQKLERYQKFYSAYPNRIGPRISIKKAIDKFEEWLASKKTLKLVGRIVGLRNQGKIIFVDLKDFDSRIQLVLKKDLTSEFELLADCIDIGDFLWAKGRLFKTKTREKSLLANQARLISKSLRPLPQSWYGLKDIEKRLRHRELDFILNPSAKNFLVTRSKIISSLTKILHQYGFQEVQTPILQPVAGGAKARPFKTRWQALGQDVYLRIAPELYLKRLLVAGFEKIFELGKNFRNEGIDRVHYPEFTMLELYWAYKDYKFLMKFTKNVLTKLFKQFKPNKLVYQKKSIDINNWQTLTFNEAIKRYAPHQKGEPDQILSKKVKPNLIDPTFIIDHPKSISPLAKSKPDNPELVERFQLYIGGIELANGYTELNNPLEQRKRMSKQKNLDENFLEALEYGMPPAAGVGIGIDRLVALIVDSHSIREVISFPVLKSK